MENAEWIECKGEAHSPIVAGNIDHCGICMPWWGAYPICPKCKKRLTQKGFCNNCRKYFEVEQNENNK